MKEIKIEAQSLTYNDCVKLAYHKVLKQAKQLLAMIEHDELRCTLERSDNVEPVKQKVVHEFINPLLYLKLDAGDDGNLRIHFGVEEVNKEGRLSVVTSAFLRFLYKVTMFEAYPVNIEDCVKTDWFLKNQCSEAYDYIEGKNKYHSFRRLKYNGKVTKQKALMVEV